MDTIGQVPQGASPMMGQNPMIAVHPSSQKNSKNILIALLVVIALAAIAWFGYFSKMNTGEIQTALQMEAEQGRLVAGFPGALIVVDDATIWFSRKYDMDIAGRMIDSYTTQYTTKTFPGVLMGQYLSYMKNNGFEFQKSQTDKGVIHMSGDRIIGSRGENLSVTIIPPENIRTETRVHVIFNNTK